MKVAWKTGNSGAGGKAPEFLTAENIPIGLFLIDKKIPFGIFQLVTIHHGGCSGKS
jgi:hypothetical protein